jgi:hypothetical protein
MLVKGQAAGVSNAGALLESGVSDEANASHQDTGVTEVHARHRCRDFPEVHARSRLKAAKEVVRLVE